MKAMKENIKAELEKQTRKKNTTHEAQDGERCQGNRRSDLKILGDEGKLGVKSTNVTRGRGNLIIVR